MTEVKLYVYDLSNGLARSLSLAFIGQHIDAIYHTSIVIFGREYYFGQGIQESLTPGKTPYGAPIEILPMGFTNLTKLQFESYLSELSVKWTPDKYHLLDNNCNHFTNEVCLFLVGREIPRHISDLPDNFAQTALGRQLRPMLDAMFGGSGVQVGNSRQFVASQVKGHPHLKLGLGKKNLDERVVLIEYQHGSFASMSGKIKESLDKSDLDKEWVESFLASFKEQKVDEFPSDFGEKAVHLIETLPEELKFVWFDLLRVLVVRNTAFIDKQFQSDTLKERLLKNIYENCLASRLKPVNLVFTGLRLLSNILSKPASLLCKYLTIEDPKITINNALIPPFHLVTRIFLSHFLVSSTDYSDIYQKELKIKQVVASIAFNISVFCNKQRLEMKKESEFYVEVTSALIHYFSSEISINGQEEEEISYRLLCALWINIWMANEEILQLAQVMGLNDGLKKLSEKKLGDRWNKLIGEFSKMVSNKV